MSISFFFLDSHFGHLPPWLQYKIESADSSSLFWVQQSSVESSVSVIYVVSARMRTHRHLHTHCNNTAEKLTAVAALCIWISLPLLSPFFYLETSSDSSACVFWRRGIVWRMDGYRFAVRLSSPGGAHGQHTSPHRLLTHHHAPGCGEENTHPPLGHPQATALPSEPQPTDLDCPWASGAAV